MQSPRAILRCTTLEEDKWLPLERLALLCESRDNLPEGYGMYLLVNGSNEDNDLDRSIFSISDQIEPGDFVRLTENASGELSVMQLATADKPERTLFLTGQCNSDCLMCPYSTRQRVAGEPEPVDDLLEYVELMSPDTDYICLTGGEPTLLKDGFLSVLESVKHHLRYALVHILTNGRTFSYPDFFAAYQRVRPYQTLLGIPIHSPTAALHDRISGAPGSFEQTIRGIENCYRGREHIELRIVTSALNVHQLADLARFIGRHFPAVSCVSLMGLEMMGNAMINRQDVWISFDELMPFVEEAADILLSYGVAPRLFNYPLCKVSSCYHSIYHRSISEEKVRYKPECDGCSKMEACGGFFRTTMVMPDIIVNPYC